MDIIAMLLAVSDKVQMLPEEAWAAMGVIATAVATYFGTRYLEKKKAAVAAGEQLNQIELTRLTMTYDEIARLRGNQNILFQRLQDQISEQDEKLDDLEDWAEDLIDHIKKGLGWPPPPRPSSNRRRTEPIDLSAQPPLPSLEELTQSAREQLHSDLDHI